MLLGAALLSASTQHWALCVKFCEKCLHLIGDIPSEDDNTILCINLGVDLISSSLARVDTYEKNNGNSIKQALSNIKVHDWSYDIDRDLLRHAMNSICSCAGRGCCCLGPRYTFKDPTKSFLGTCIQHYQHTCCRYVCLPYLLLPQQDLMSLVMDDMDLERGCWHLAQSENKLRICQVLQRHISHHHTSFYNWFCAFGLWVRGS